MDQEEERIRGDIPSCLLLGLKSAQVTTSLWPLKFLSRVGSSCKARQKIAKQVPAYKHLFGASIPTLENFQFIHIYI